MYYKIPFNFGDIINGKDSHICSLAESIAQHIQLLITTKFGESRYNPKYGNAIWELEFERAINESKWTEEFRQSVLKAIISYEPRLVKVYVEIHAELVEKTWPMKNYTEIKKKVTILVKANLIETDEKFSFKTDLFLSPMSVD